MVEPRWVAADPRPVAAVSHFKSDELRWPVAVQLRAFGRDFKVMYTAGPILDRGIGFYWIYPSFATVAPNRLHTQ